MRRLTPIVLLLLLLGAACTQPAETKYELFTSDEGRFQAEFPSTPKREAVTVTAQGTTLSLIALTSGTPTEAVSVSFVDYPQGVNDDNRAAVLNGAASGSASTLTGTLASNKPTTFLGYSALDFVVNSDSGKATARTFLIGPRLYLLQVVQTGEDEEESASFRKLLGTFKAFPGPSPTPAASPAPGASPAASGTAAVVPSVVAPSSTPAAGFSTPVSPSLFPIPQRS